MTYPRNAARHALLGLAASALALSSGAGLFAPRADAADLPRVLVLPYAPIYDGLPPSDGMKAGDVLVNELKSSEQLQLATLPESAAPVVVSAAKAKSPGPDRNPAALGEARDRASRAQDLIKKLKFKQAAEELEKAIALLEGQYPYVEFEDLIGHYLDAAVAYFRLGQDTEGERALAQVVRLDPERKLDSEKYPPVFLRAYDNVSKRVKKAPRGSIKVDANTAATVVVDGREVGVAPMVVGEVVKGVHFVKVGDGWATRVDVPAGETIQVTAEVGGPASSGNPSAEILAALGRNVIDESVIKAAVALAGKASADYVVFGGVHKEGEGIVVSSHLLKVATRKVCQLQRVVYDLEMLSASIEVYKVGTDLVNKLEVFGDEERLPGKVARDALAGKPSVASSTPSVPADPAGRIVRRNDAPPASDRPQAVKTEVRKITANPDDQVIAPVTEPLGPADELKPPPPSRTWIYVLAGVAVVGGLAAGGYLYYDASTQPITGKGTLTW